MTLNLTAWGQIKPGLINDSKMTHELKRWLTRHVFRWLNWSHKCRPERHRLPCLVRIWKSHKAQPGYLARLIPWYTQWFMCRRKLCTYCSGSPRLTSLLHNMTSSVSWTAEVPESNPNIYCVYRGYSSYLTQLNLSIEVPCTFSS